MSTRASWLEKSPFGVMVHYIPVIADRQGSREKPWNDCVRDFDVEGFADTLTYMGAQWLIMPFGQNHGEYLSPNPVLKKYLGDAYFTDRDLMRDIADALKQRGITLVCYMPTEVWSHDEEVREALGWNRDPVDKSAFMDIWYEAVSYWGTAFGEDIAGWWFDGCYRASEKGFIPEGRNQWSNERFDKQRWIAAARAGNKNRAFSMCPGANAMTYVYPEEDFLCGEANELLGPPEIPSTMKQHCLSWLDCFWANNPDEKRDDGVHITKPRFTPAELCGWVQQFQQQGGGCTMNIGIYRDGTLAEQSVEVLKEVSSLLTPHACP